MKIERDKFLTEAMGKCWHEWAPYGFIAKKCLKCLILVGDEIENPDFSTWVGFGELWGWAQGEDWWEDFILGETFWDNPKLLELITESLTSLVHPDRFADAVYEFLGGG